MGVSPSDQAWRELAARLGGRPVITPSWLGPPVRRIEFDVEGAILTLEKKYSLSEGWFTRLYAEPLESVCSAYVSVARRGTSDELRQRLARSGRALAEELTGDDAFDGTWRALSHPIGVALSLFDEGTRRLVGVAKGGFEIDGRRLTVLRGTAPERADQLEGVLRYAQALVRRWAELARAPGAMAEALRLTPVRETPPCASGAAAIVARGVRQGRELTLSIATDPYLMTVIRCGVVKGAPFSIYRLASGLAGGGLAPESLCSLAEAAPRSLARVVGEREYVSLMLVGVSHDRGELDRLADALIDATRVGSVYR